MKPLPGVWGCPPKTYSKPSTATSVADKGNEEGLLGVEAVLSLIEDDRLGAFDHVVGERAVEIVQVVAIAMAGGLRVDELVRVPLSFPTYTGILVRAAYRALEQIDPRIQRTRSFGERY